MTFIGIDAGTSVTKAAAFDENGTFRAVESAPTQLDKPGDGWYEQDIDAVVEAVATVVRRLVAKVGAPTAIGLTGQGDGVWIVDADGRPTRPAVSWMDARGSSILQEWLNDGLVDAVFRTTGNMMFPGCAAPVLAWLDRHEPDALDGAAVAGYCKDVVMQRLTGLQATDASDASLPFLEPVTRSYSESVLESCGLSHRRDLLAPVVEPCPVGEVSAEATELLGVPAGTPISAGPFDLVASAVGSGVRVVGDGHLIIGTTLGCQVVVDDVDTSGEAAGMTLATGAPGRWLRTMPAMVGTAALDWVLTLVREPHERLDELLKESPPGAHGVRCLPYFSPAGERAPFVEPRATARFEGLSLQTTDADLVRATCEAIAFAARHCFAAAGLAGDVAACGGGVRSTAWAQLFADVLGQPLQVAEMPELGAYGAVITAAGAIDPSFDPASWYDVSVVIEPDEGRAAYYSEVYQHYVAAVDQARASWSAA